MKKVILLSLLSVFFVGCSTVKEKMAESSDENHQVLGECVDKGTDSVKDSNCQKAAKEEASEHGDKVKAMMK